MRTVLALLFFALSGALGCAGTNHHFVRDAYALELRCPESKVVVLNFLGNDKRRGNQWQAYGCGQRRTCFDNSDKGRWECRWPDDLQAAAAQLQLMTNCPVDQMRPVAYNETKKGPTMDDSGGDWDWPGGAWRIDTCGTGFMCTVTETSRAICQQVPDLTPAASQPPLPLLPPLPPAISPPPPPPPPPPPG
jgi:hypothetical protein